MASLKAQFEAAAASVKTFVATKTVPNEGEVLSSPSVFNICSHRSTIILENRFSHPVSTDKLKVYGAPRNCSTLNVAQKK